MHLVELMSISDQTEMNMLPSRQKKTCQFHITTYHSYNGISLLCTGAKQMQKITDLRTHNIAYDYESVMHYSR